MMKSHSGLMRFFLALGMKRVAWACRRLYCPVPAEALVLEVGSGGSPYFRANVLIDAYGSTRERHWAPLVTDRPSVLGFGEALPFKDKAFDFVIASHVLEHSAEPEKFIKELQRVAKAGYIETPDAFMERINPYWDHRSEVTIRDGTLSVRKKACWKADAELVDLYEFKAKDIIARKTIVNDPFVFHTRFFWENEIAYNITNPETDASWPAPEFSHSTNMSQSLRARIGRGALYLARRLFSQNRRNRKLDLLSLLLCPSCGSRDIVGQNDYIQCEACSAKYAMRHGVPEMYPSFNA